MKAWWCAPDRKVEQVALLWREPPGNAIDLAGLAQAARREGATKEDQAAARLTWQCIQRNHPPLADMIENDPLVKEIREAFNAGLVIHIPG